MRVHFGEATGETSSGGGTSRPDGGQREQKAENQETFHWAYLAPGCEGVEVGGGEDGDAIQERNGFILQD